MLKEDTRYQSIDRFGREVTASFASVRIFAMAPLFHIHSLLFTALALLTTYASAIKEGYVKGVIDGKEYLVADNRRPSLYTKDYGDCMGGSLFNVTRFDAAYYKDNMTIMFHLGGETLLRNESIMSTYASKW